MLNFPDELIEHILAYVRLPSHLFQCLVASKRFNVITQRLLTDITFESLSQRKNFCQVVSKPSQLQLIKKLNFGLKPDPEKTESMYGGVWEHRIVNDVLLDMLESVFVESLSHFSGLEGLNVSYSSLKGSALVAVARLVDRV
ncbi:hypothetical protein BC829DRAFT_439839 [Chytridium lagenaria]|nr:hypothetical protein BC829DRAFT_439839 [Chytridium lagenaria]